MTLPLHVVIRGEGEATPLILLHGFGGEAASWLAVQTALTGRRKVLAFDLPGHGQSRDHPANSYDDMAQAVIEQLTNFSISRFHLAAHSMGGAVATTLALQHPDQIASLTLLCPGGFGGLVNEALIHRFARATDAVELQTLLASFFGKTSMVPRHVGQHLAAARTDPAVAKRLTELLNAMIDGPHQIPVDKQRLGDLPCSVRVLWGEQDQVQSAHTIADLPPYIALHRFAAAGHMLHVEAAREVAHILRLQMQGD